MESKTNFCSSRVIFRNIPKIQRILDKSAKGITLDALSGWCQHHELTDALQPMRINGYLVFLLVYVRIENSGLSKKKPRSIIGFVFFNS